VNVDLEAPAADLHADLRRPLPFDDGQAALIFCEHFIEHIRRDDALNFLRECRRVLRPGGRLRLSTPDLRWLVAQYVAGNLDEWQDVDWRPATTCRLMNEGMRSWGHEFLYDREELLALLGEAGFDRIEAVAHRESRHPELAGLECRPWHRELILEAERTDTGA
jgi:predicted SAM-dependent methyltransferase